MQKTLQNIFLGIAIGDAFGAGLEFQDRNWIKKNIDFTRFINRRQFINHNDIELFVKDYVEWQYTDDTEMTIGVVKALITNANFDKDFLVESIKSEYQCGYEKKGYYRNGHGALRWYFNGEKSLDEIRSFQKGRKYPGNAPVVRAIPFGFIHESKINAYAEINAMSTHPNNRAVEASIVIARVTKAVILDKIELNTIIRYCSKYVKDSEFLELLNAADFLPEPNKLEEKDYLILCGTQPLQDFIPGLNGLPSCAMHTAISIVYILKHSTSTFEGLKHSINIGGDVDSLASVVTGILAGKFGLTDIPDYMKEHVEGVSYLRDLAISFYKFILQEHENNNHII